MKFSYDKYADAVYIRAKSAKIKRTEKFQDDILIDFDAENKVRGIEILNVSEWLSKDKTPSVEIGNRKIPIPA
ncbi:DUF2283 domain-containing protein [Candidatus Parcubacteria bacterium]|nr:MAG: DUF2283 domain-containing protein [Candidatus Parcubacteria bacterium]